MNRLSNKVLEGEELTKEEVADLWDMPLDELRSAANQIREKFCGKSFDLCTIINAKSGQCTEDCKFCSQSSRYQRDIDTYPFLPADEIVEDGKRQASHGVGRYSLVTAGRKLSRKDVEKAAEAIRRLKEETDLKICISCGLLSEEEFRILREAGAERVHNNLEAGPSYFPSVCTTHTTEDKLKTIAAARRAGMEICSGGIIGMGETREERAELAFTLRDLGVQSIPVNVLNPIPGTPFGDLEPMPYEEVLRSVAVFRHILPDRFLRLAGGRILFPDKGRAALRSGINAMISGDMLTTAGISTAEDLEMINDEGFAYEM